MSDVGISKLHNLYLSIASHPHLYMLLQQVTMLCFRYLHETSYRYRYLYVASSIFLYHFPLCYNTCASTYIASHQSQSCSPFNFISHTLSSLLCTYASVLNKSETLLRRIRSLCCVTRSSYPYQISGH